VGGPGQDKKVLTQGVLPSKLNQTLPRAPISEMYNVNASQDNFAFTGA